MIAYAIMSSLCDTPVEVFVEREDAEVALADVLEDEPGFSELLRIEEVELGPPVSLS